MCGLAGVLEPGAPADLLRAAASSLCDRQAHRGPDGAGVWGDEGIALAHRRLAILDPSERGAQPMQQPGGRWVLVQNGEIYNHLELRASLPGPWLGTSDTETLLRALEVRGIACVEQLAGMFALAAWDRRERTLYLVRDRIGIKPLHYLVRGERFAFASEPSALAADVGGGARLDREALASYLALGYPPLEQTLFLGVRSVLPGEIVAVREGGLTRRRYWQLPAHCEARSEPHWDEEFDAVWRSSTRQHLLSDVPMGLFLSGGLDSSAVAVAVAGQRLDLHAFCAGFADAAFDESGHALAMARKLGFASHRLTVDTGAAEELLPLIARHADTPCSDSSQVGTWLLAREAAREVKVVLSGDGADEVFGGYATHQATALLLSPLGPPLRWLSALVGDRLPAPPASKRPVGLGQKLVRLLRHARHEPLGAHLRWRTLLDAGALREIAGPLADPCSTWDASLARYPGQPALNRAFAADVEGYLVQDELVRLDRMGMAHGLEMRVPFLDHRVVELAFRMPPEAKLRNRRGKWPVLRWLAAQGHGDLARRPKRGFNHPLRAWFRGSLGERLLEGLRDSALRPLLDERAAGRWLTRHRAGWTDRSYELWNVLFLVEWARAHRVQL